MARAGGVVLELAPQLRGVDPQVVALAEVARAFQARSELLPLGFTLAVARDTALAMSCASCSLVSTPSAVTERLSAWPSSITAPTIATSSELCGSPRTKERSIFTQSIGKRRRCSSDE